MIQIISFSIVDLFKPLKLTNPNPWDQAVCQRLVYLNDETWEGLLPAVGAKFNEAPMSVSKVDTFHVIDYINSYCSIAFETNEMLIKNISSQAIRNTNFDFYSYLNSLNLCSCTIEYLRRIEEIINKYPNRLTHLPIETLTPLMFNENMSNQLGAQLCSLELEILSSNKNSEDLDLPLIAISTLINTSTY